MRVRRSVVLAVVVAAILGAGTVVARPTARAAASVNCDSAAYPSLAWGQCEYANGQASNGNWTLYGSIFPQTLAATADYQAQRAQIPITDSERQPNPSPCSLTCWIDPRVNGWSGIVRPVLYTSRSGATMSAHIWADSTGPAKRPAVVIINGSIVGYEQAYWYAAQTLAKAGFVVMTFDSQGEGMSDQFGESPDQNEDAFAGTPFLGSTPGQPPGFGGNGLPFYDGGTDALNFLLSTPATPYVPVPSRTSGTSHSAKQQRRVLAGKNSAYNPLWDLVDATAIGVTGHSYGAIAASWLGQQDPRISAVVAWDTLCKPASPAPDEAASFPADPVNRPGGLFAPYGVPNSCFGAPPGPAPALTKPALGISGDYLGPPSRYMAPPDPVAKSAGSRAYTAAAVDSGHITIRGGTHLEMSAIPASGAATLRGIDLTSWYTVAWFKKYLQHDPAGDTMLLSDRWRSDTASAAADSVIHDPNVFSWHYRSRLDIGLASGARFDCENLRVGCTGQAAAVNDGGPASYSWVAAR